MPAELLPSFTDAIDALVKLAMLVLLICGPILAREVVKLLKAQAEKAQAAIDQIQDERIREVLHAAAQYAVLAAEQIHTDNSEKLEFAMHYAEAYLLERGLTVDLEVVHGAIEAAVLDEFGGEDVPAEPEYPITPSLKG